MQAIVTTTLPSGRPGPALKTVALPGPPAADELLVKVDAVGLNLVDARYAYYPIKQPEEEDRVLGSDFSGTVVEVAAPSPVSPSPASAPATLLICGASTILGQLAVQLARASPLGAQKDERKRLRIVATASERNHALVRSLGADAVYDYRSPRWVEDVRAFASSSSSSSSSSSAGGAVTLAFDCISEGATARLCASTMDLERGGKLAVVEKGFEREGIPESVEVLPGLCWTALGKRVEYTHRPPLEPSSTSLAFLRALHDYLSPPSSSSFNLVALPSPPKIRLMPGGLERVVPDGFSLLGTTLIAEREKTDGVEEEDGDKPKHLRPISAEKLVYRIS
ncbi:hypothetical protein JCM8097_002837 [Rhodosporidiobolus ruineniae]